MKTQPRLAIRVAAVALALSAYGIAVGTSAGTPVAYASSMPARHGPGDTRFADLRELAQVKRDVAWAAVQRGRARPAPVDTRFADLRELAQVKRDVAWAAVERAWARQAPTDASRFADLRELAQVKRDVAWAAVERAWGR
jgi:hypothetical protein